jgi:predicted RNA binding protein YcfA (HicA-like mRNA interferase family)
MGAPGGRTVTIPIHGGDEIGPPLFFRILRQLGLTLEQFNKLR